MPNKKGGQCPRCVRGAMPKNLLNKNGNSQEVKGYAHLKVKGNAQKVREGQCPKPIKLKDITVGSK